MRLVDADELLEHAWRDKLDSRELIAKMIQDAPTVKEIPTTIPIEIFERLLSSDREHGEWIHKCISGDRFCECSVCHSQTYQVSQLYEFCPHCGADMRGKKNE